MWVRRAMTGHISTHARACTCPPSPPHPPIPFLTSHPFTCVCLLPSLSLTPQPPSPVPPSSPPYFLPSPLHLSSYLSPLTCLRPPPAVTLKTHSIHRFPFFPLSPLPLTPLLLSLTPSPVPLLLWSPLSPVPLLLPSLLRCFPSCLPLPSLHPLLPFLLPLISSLSHYVSLFFPSLTP